MKIYTKTGDDGTSGLIGGTRIKKFDTRLEAYGTVDELNSAIGIVASLTDNKPRLEAIKNIQETLFLIGSHLATDESSQLLKTNMPCQIKDIELLEKEIDKMQVELPALKSFVLPSGCQASAQAHLARTICRRAERRIVELNEIIQLEENLMIYINRLSDYLFVLSRMLNKESSTPEILWKPQKNN